jgi:ectoine hydroxylase-related dioxygenase (phytanoyl-CoA dioxygenase family)
MRQVSTEWEGKGVGSAGAPVDEAVGVIDALDSEIGLRMDAIKHQVEANGYAVVSEYVSEEDIQALELALDGRQHGVRNLLSNPVVRRIASSCEIKRAVASVLGEGCFAVRGILFNKNPKANWKVTWHQDCVIAVREKRDIKGWGPWSNKANVIHVRPTAAVLREMLAVRIHLDDCGEENGPLRVIPGSHRAGFLSDAEVQAFPKDGAVSCSVVRGDAILMRPLILHSSSPATKPSNRRVVHIEFAAAALPDGAEWQERVYAETKSSAAGRPGTHL